MIGAYVPGDAWNVQEIAKINAASDKNLAFVTIFSAFSHDWKNQLQWQASNIYNNAAVPLITWMPVDTENKSADLLPEIVKGQWDGYIDNWIDGLLSWVDSYPGHKKPIVMLRFGHEFNGNWYPYSGRPALFVEAWKRIHDRFSAKNANDYVEWIWSANHIDFDDHKDMTLYYPGNAYVDWTSLDGYNWGTNHAWTEWDSFEDLFASAYHTLITHYPDKPILIAEYSTAEPADLPSADWMQYGNNNDNSEDKSVWFHDTLKIIEQRYPAIRGLGLFNINKELSWSVTEPHNTGIDGYNLGLASNYYTSSFLGARLVVMGAAIDAETLRQLQEPPEPVFDFVIDGTASQTEDAPVLYYSTDRLRTNTVQRELINIDDHKLLSRVLKPSDASLQAAREKAVKYQQRFRQLTQDQQAQMARSRMRLVDY